MIETLRAIGGFVLIVAAGLLVFFLFYFTIKNFKRLALILIVFGLILTVAVGVGLFVGGLIDSLVGAEFKFFSVLFGASFGIPALLIGGRWIWGTFVQEKEWWPNSKDET